MPAAEIETATLRVMVRRLLPLLMLCYFVAYVDRVNVGFAALTMNRDVGLSAAAFGTGAGIFFLSYFLFEVPSNLAVERLGARRWIARIMVSWGVVAMAMALVVGPRSFYAMRFLLGAAEAGFFPGILFFLTLWFPRAHRARVVGWFMAAIPLSTIIGAPVSGLILGMDGVLGLRGWQWLYVLEGAPAVLLGLLLPWMLADRPEQAGWLTEAQRGWLCGRLAQERGELEASSGRPGVMQALLDGRVLALSLVYFGAISCTFGVAFWLPQMIKGYGFSDVGTGFATAIPYLFGMAGMLGVSRRSDRTGERHLHCAAGLLLGAAGLLGSTAVGDPVLKIAMFSVAAFGFLGCQPVFWAIPSSMLGGRAAAGGLALINALGGLAGFFGPFVMGAVRQATGSYVWGIATIAGCAVVAAAIVLALRASAGRTAPLPATAGGAGTA